MVRWCARAISALLLLFSFKAFAAGEAAQTFTLDGTLYNTSDFSTPLLDSSAELTIQILDPAKNCIIYEEVQTVNTSSTKGKFNIQVGSAVGAGKRALGGNDPGHTMWRVFQNVSSISATNAGCPGFNYSPSSGDVRYVRIKLKPTSGATITMTPDMVLGAQPTAVIAESVQGLDRTKIAEFGTHINANMTAANLLSLFDGSDVGSLHNHDSQYAKLNASTSITLADQETVGFGRFTNVQEATLTGGLNNTTDVGKTWYNSDTDKLMFWDGATAIAVGAGGAGTGDLLADGTVAMTADFNFGSNKGVNLAAPTAGTDAANKTYVDGLITGLSTTYVATAGDAMTGDLTMNAQSDVRFADAAGGEYAAIQAPATIGTNYTLTLPADDGTPSQVLTTDGSGVLSWTTPAGGGSMNDVVDDTTPQLGGNLDVNGNNFTSTAGMDFAIGASAGNDFTVDTNKLVVEGDTGNVGIGTATPVTTFDISGDGTLYRGNQFSTADKILQVQDDTQAVINLISDQNSDGANLGGLYFSRSQGQDASHYTVAGIKAIQNGTGATAGGSMVFYTKSGGATSERMRLTNTGQLAGMSRLGLGTVTNPGQMIQGDISTSTGALLWSSHLQVTNTGPGGVGGYYFQGTHNNAGTATNAYGIQIDPLTVSSGAVTNNYGLYLANGTAATNNYGVYQTDAGANNYFAGSVGIGTTTPNASAILDVSSTTKGFAPPRMTTGERTGITSPIDGLMVYDVTLDQMFIRAGGAWTNLAAGGGADNLGNHTATANLQMGANNISNDGGAGEGLSFDTDGNATFGQALTSTSDFTVSAQSDVRFADSAGGEYAAIQAPATIGTNYTLTLPVDDGTPSQVLTTDGSGVLSWTTPAGTTYTADGDGIELTSTTFGLELDGTTLSKGASGLSVNVGTGANQIVQLDGSSELPAVDGSNLTGITAAQVSALADVVEDLTPQLGGTLDMNGQNVSTATGFNIDITGSAAGNDFTVDTNKFVVSGDTGNVGIGTATPNGNLFHLYINDTNTNQFKIEQDGAGDASMVFLQTGIRAWQMGIDSSDSNKFKIGSLEHTTWNDTRLTIDNSGNVGIGTTSPDASAILDVSSTTKGFLPPRMDESDRDAISSPAEGLLIYNIDDDKLNTYDGGAWQEVGAGGTFGTGNSGFVGSATYASKANCIWTNTNASMSNISADSDCNTATTEGSASAPGGKYPGVTFTSLPAGRYRVILKNVLIYAGPTTECNFKMWDGSNYSGYTYLFDRGSSSTLVADYTYTTAQSSITFRVRANRDSGTGSCEIYGDTAYSQDPTISVVRIDGNTSAIQLADDDGDTGLNSEASSDEDILRFRTAGTERMTINASGAVNMTGALTANSFTGDGSALTNIGASAIADNSITVADLNFASTDGVNIPQLTSDPSTPTAGQMYYNTTNNKMMVYNGSSWTEVGSGSGAGGGGIASIQTFTASGTWNKPAGIDKIKAICTGGGGGGQRGNGQSAGGSGGGAGATAIEIIDVSGVSSVTVTIGAGGAKGSGAGGPGSAGGNTSFGSYITADGGAGGSGNAGGTGGTVSVSGDVDLPGGMGTTGGDVASGVNVHPEGGMGGASYWGGGGKGTRTDGTDAPNATAPGAGGGGGGASASASSQANGGDGAAGICVVYEYATSSAVMVADADSDTLIQTQESSDEDIIRFDTAGSERMVINATGAVGVGTASPDASSLLDITSTTKGFLPPRMTEAQRDAIGTPATGLTVYNTNDNELNYYDGSAWQAVGAGGGFGSGNSGFVGSLTYASTVDCNWTTTSGTMTDITDDSDCPNPTTEGSASAPAAKYPGITFTSLPAGRYRVTMTGAIFYAGASTECLFKMWDGSNLSGQVYDWDDSGSDILTGEYEYSTAQSNITFRVRGQRPSGAGICTINANDTYSQNPTISVVRIDGNTSAVQLADDDGDTTIHTEESSDEDIIRFDTAGVERMTINASGAVNMTGDLTANSFTGDGSGLTNIGASAIADNSITVADLDFASTNGINVPQQSSAPGSPTTGQMYFDTTENKLKVYNGSSWTDVGSSSGTVGLIGSFPTATCPTGWLAADGSAVSRTTYASLFSSISSMYGAGDGTTTFNLPDYRGQFLRGVAGGEATDPDRAGRTDRGDGTTGDNVGTKQADEFKSHSHTVNTFNNSVNASSGSGASYHRVNTQYGSSTGTAGGNETRPTNVYVTYCISYSGGVSGGGFEADGSAPMTGNISLNDNYLSNDGGNEGIRIDNDGKVGIGTATPTSELHVFNSSADPFLTIEGRNTALGEQGIRFRHAGDNSAGYIGSITKSGGGWGSLVFSIQDESFGEIMRIDADTSNVGIGTTSPDAKLHVDGDIKMGNSSATCNSSAEGSMRYNSTSKKMEFCEGSTWTEFDAPARTPAGAVQAFAQASCPTGWLDTDGSAVSRTTYADLFSAIGVMYGNGNGSTTFDLPDYRGYFLRGVDDGAGRDPNAGSRSNRGDGTTGDNVGTTQADEFGEHSHDSPRSFSPNTYSWGTGGGFNAGFTYPGGDNTSTEGGDETRPKNINVLYCIKH